MNGEIGVLYQDKQVGGVYSWDILVSLDTSIYKGFKHSKPSKKILIMGYWLLSEPKGNEFNIELYKQVNDQLVLMDAGVVKIDFPDKTLDKKLLAQLELGWVRASEY